MSVPKSEHTVYMYNNDYNTVCTEVYNHQRIETGGNLFGLWTTSGSAVIHVVLGPGRDCRRTTTSFHQDIEYMKRVGHFVNDHYMLCHIGEWHSHHRLSLDKPSPGDEQTVRRNFPQGMSKFLVIIANIVDGGDRITLSPYFFTHGGTQYEKAEFKVLKTNSPFSSDVEIMKQIELGAEGKDQHRSALVVVANSSGGNPQNAGSSHNGSPSYSQVTQGSTKGNPDTHTGPTSPGSNAGGDRVEPMDTSDDDLKFPPRNYHPWSNSPSTFSSQTATDQNAFNVRNTTSSHHSSHSIQNAPDHSRGLEPPSDYKRSSSTPVPVNTTPASRLALASSSGQVALIQNENYVESLLKQIHDELKKWFGSEPEAKFEFESSKEVTGCGSVIDIKFKHNNKFWTVRFPGDFPAKPAKLFSSSLLSSLRFCEVYDLVKPLDSQVNILLSIKKNCMYVRECDVCKHFTKESLSPSSSNPRSIEKLTASSKEVIEGITASSVDMDGLNMKCLSDSHAEITFEHGRWYWIIDIPGQFPDMAAKVYYLFQADSPQKRDAFVCLEDSHGPQELKTSKLIIKAIQLNCVCLKCIDARRQDRKTVR